MHMLFPEKVPADDPTGDKSWDYDRWVDNTGSKWSPDVNKCCSEVVGVTILDYDSAWTPNNGTLKRLHEKTGWTIRNDYREEGAQFAGTLICEAGTCRDEEREYMSICEVCEQEKPDACFDEEQDELICDDCRRKAVPRRCNPRPQLFTDGQYLQLLTNGQKSSQLPDFQPMPVVKLFTPDGAATWLLSEIYPDDPSTAYGLCDLGMGHPEFGDINLPEIASLRGKLGLPVERDLHFTAIKTLIQYAEEARPLGRINA